MPDALSRLRSELAGRYDVEQELGSGGMAVVYLAKDVRHGRKVAIKVLRQDVGGASAERFLREIRTVAQLHHPHILQLLDSGTAGDHLFYVMPYVEGETLRQRLEREGPMPIDEAVRLAREVADGLTYAHARGIVHRDIKPENIFLSAGHALLADFGIARAASAASETTLTDVGLTVGTPAYMSPEQATAEPKIDGRSDQYALGCVLYEMLAGAPPFTGPTSQVILARHMADPVPPLRTVRDVSSALESAIMRALEKMPADRWLSARAFSESLELSVVSRAGERMVAASAQHGYRRRTSLGVATAAIALGILATQPIWSRPEADQSALRSLVLRPFVSRGDSLSSLYAAGMAGGLLAGLTKVEGVSVQAPERVANVADASEDDVTVGKKLRVDHVLSGEVQLRNGKLRVTPRLTRVADGATLWTDNYYADQGDVFSILDSMAVKIVAALVPWLGEERQALAARGPRTTDSKAYELYLHARRATFEVTREGVERALALLDEALERDSLFADAWLARAEAYSFYRQVGSLSPAEVTSRYRNSLERAIELDDQNGYALALRAQLRALYDWEHDRARADLRRALDLSPGSAEVEWMYGALMNLFLEPDSALTHMRRAVDLDPRNPFLWFNLSMRFQYLDQPESMLSAARRAVSLDSTTWLGHYMLSVAYMKLGRPEMASREVEETLRLSGNSSPLALALVSTHRQRGPEMLDRLEALSRKQHVPAIYLAVARASVRDREGALVALEESAEKHEADLAWFVDDFGFFDFLRGDERYEAIRLRVFGDRLYGLRLRRSSAPPKQ
jgi:serine/threonine-protein kinase